MKTQNFCSVETASQAVSTLPFKILQAIFIILIIGLSNKVISQPLNYTGWFFQNPLPTANPLQCVKFIDAYTGFAVGSASNIIKTTDGGLNWFLNYDMLGFPNKPFYSLFFVNNNTGYVTGDNGIFGKWTFKSTNCGESWFNLTEGLGGTSIYFPSPDTGFLAAGQIYKTTNAGANWISLAGTNNVSKLFFINNSTGYGVGWPGTILKTTNGGSNWTLNTAGQQSFNAVYFPANDMGYILNSYEVYKTTNAGMNWFKPLYSLSHSGTDIYFTDTQTGYVSASDLGGGYVLKTTNGGYNWNTIYYDPQSGFNSILFTNQFTGYAVGELGDIIYTTDAGGSWVNQKKDITDKRSLFTIQFVNENTGFAGGGYTDRTNGIIAKTTNAGVNWFRQVSDTINAIEEFHFLNSETGYVVGDIGTILKTTNGGGNWKLQDPGIQSDFYSVYFLNTQTGYIAGGFQQVSQVILKTTNGGINWVTPFEQYSLDAFYSIRFIDQNTGYATGPPQIYRTTNGGNNWYLFLDLLQFNNCSGCTFFKMEFINSSTGFIVGQRFYLGPAVIYKTTNSGLNWSRYNDNSLGAGLYSINFADLNTGYACGFITSIILKTTNCGTNWYRYNTISDQGFFDLDFTNANTGYVVGTFGRILKTTTGGGNIIGMEPVSNSVPDKFYLHQNYPNPFNPTTKIIFSLPTPSQGRAQKVKLVIFDILGRKTSTLVNEQLKPGTYEVEWNGSAYASGIYFYRLETEDFMETRKMLIVK